MPAAVSKNCSKSGTSSIRSIKHFERIGGWRLAAPEVMAHNFGKPRQLVYSSWRQRRKFNAQLDFLGAPADIILHPDTAGERGIVDGARVRVFNKSGDIFLTVKLDPGMRKSVGSISHGHKHANVNFLTSTQDIDPLGGMAFYSGVPIEIEPAVNSVEAGAGG